MGMHREGSMDELLNYFHHWAWEVDIGFIV